MKLKYILLVAVILFLWPISAQSTESILCTQTLSKPKYLLEVGQAAIKAKKKICAAESQLDKNLAYFDFLEEIKGWFDRYGGFKDNLFVVDAIRKRITIDNPSVTVDLSIRNKLQVGTDAFEPANEQQCILISQASSCVDVLEDFKQLYVEIQNSQAEAGRLKTLKSLNELKADWEPFLEKMKGQTALELLINQQVYKNDSDTFSGPPASQWIVLHPMVLIENVSAAENGENTQEALGLEIIGMNWWKQEKWYMPSGGSVLAVYSDRADIDDVGYGLALHFQSNYTIGYTNHDGEDGVFISVDLIKLFQDKNKVFDSYKSAFD
ncbi:hypothetical protein BCU94_18785 [Shewanella sp. 10N.286.52.C2]|uniref:hypothetical protein n=1 Tax=Shewanella sp. 10N.286.52.C2 TaxID=1880838 RepID=UPI000C8205D7|nr:hypothetical protein [Shewanella sp. 10N.286.52.C2]PMG27802.1 hypothetical protein BCU94_18785 [Shewanella sp. 10N.286.52.C2]